ncbi:TPA: Abi-alpha family protein [Streptococcus agalactiae]
MVNDLNNNFYLNADDTLKPIKNVLEPISYALYSIIVYFLGPQIEQGIQDKAKVDYLVNATAKTTKQIPEEYFSDENKLLIAQIVEDSIYKLSNEDFCNLFASLIASSMDKRKTVKPIYSSILKEMSSSDAKLLQYFFSNRFIFEINIQSSNHLFSNPNLYNWYWDSKYYKGIYPHNFKATRNYEQPTEMEEMYNNGIDFYQDNIETEIQFLVSKGIIAPDPNFYCHQFIPSIKKFSLENDETVQKLLKENEYSTPKTIISVEHKVYCLTTLGNELKDTLINGSDILFTEDDL